jgi:CIC family chloride channel protein
MRPATEFLPAEITVREALDRVRSCAARTWLVTASCGVVGVMDVAKLQTEPADKKLSELVGARVFPHVHSDQGLDLALDRMGTNHIDLLPVVSRANVHQLEGVVILRDVLAEYGVGGPDRS